MEPDENLIIQDFAAAGGFTCEQVRQARANGELFSFRIGDESFGRYPAYQLLEEVRGQPLRALISAFGAHGGPSLSMFMSDVAYDVFGGACAAEVLCARLFSDRPVHESVAEFLELDHFTRFRAVLRASEREQLDERAPQGAPELEDWMRRRVQVGVLGSVPWITKAQLEVRVGTKMLEGWLQRHEIFCLPSVIGLELFPSYAFSADGRPSRVIPAVLKWLEYPSGLSTAAWFDSTSSFLDGARPRELIGTDPDRVLAGARDNFEMKHCL